MSRGPRVPLGRPALKDVSAGLINGVVSVPDGLASAALAGVYPIYGLYTSIVAPLFGSLLASTQRMQIATTSAAAIAAGEAIMRYPAADRAPAIFLLAIICGLLLVIGAFFRIGRLVRYISQSVMTGLLLGIAVVLILDQLGPLLGYSPAGANKPAQALDLALHLMDVHGVTAAIGIGALAVALAVNRTRWRNWSSFAALVLPTFALALLGLTGVRTVADVAPITGGLPPLSLPALRLLDLDLVLAGATLAMIVLIQGAGVSQSVENADGSPVDPNRDVLAQGVANVATGLFSGIPAGGSVGQTALNIEVGAQTRWSGVLGGLAVLLFLLVLPGPISMVPLAVLAALMIVAGLSALDLKEARALWSVGWLPRIVAAATFFTCLFVSIAAAVGVGVLLSIVIALSNAVNDVRITRLVPRGSDWIEAPVPDRIDADDPVVALDVFGSLFFAGARALAEQLPKVGTAERPVVVLRLRGYTKAGATLVDVLDHYSDELAEAGGRVYLSGLGTALIERFSASMPLVDGDDPELVAAHPELGRATLEAIRAAEEWRRSPTGGEVAPPVVARPPRRQSTGAP